MSGEIEDNPTGGSAWIKPSYCSKRDLACDECEMRYDGKCLLTLNHLRILEDIEKRCTDKQ